MSITPPALVPGAPRAPLPFGLFSVVALREGSTNRWEGGGVVFEHDDCPPSGGVIGAYSCDEDGTPGLPKEFEVGSVLHEAHPFTVYGSYKCSPLGNTLARAQEKAQERLLATEERQVETRLWAGAGVAADALPEPFSSIATPTSASDFTAAIAELEDKLASEYGSLGVVHLSRRNALLAVSDGALEIRNNRLQTALGTPAVAGAGYGDEMVVGTPALFGYRTEIFSSSNVQGDLLDRGSNDLYGIAERTYLIGFDSCGPWAVTVGDETP